MVSASWLQYSIAVMLCAITCLTIVYQPATKAVQANLQRVAYDVLYTRANSLKAEQLHEELNRLQQQDSVVLGALELSQCAQYMENEPPTRCRRADGFCQ